MQALVASRVKATVSRPPSYLAIPRMILGIAAAQPHQPRGEDAAHLLEVRRQVGIDGGAGSHASDYRTRGSSVPRQAVD